MSMDAPSPLVVIRQKEIEIADYITAAKKAAEIELLEAHQAAEEYRGQSEQLVKDQTAGDYRLQLAQVDGEAAAIQDAAERAAALAIGRGQRRMPAAVETVLKAVLPEAAPCCSR